MSRKISLRFIIEQRYVERMAKSGDSKATKNPHAVALGRIGGKARLEKMTPEQRQEIARKAIKTRWARQSKKAEAALRLPADE